MGYLTDRRAAVRDDPRNLLPSARSIVCVGKLYQTPLPHTAECADEERGWISRYAWGSDYHDEVRRGLERLDALIRERASEPVESVMGTFTDPEFSRSQSDTMRKLIAERMREMAAGDFADMLRTATREDEWLLLLHGAVLGFAGGLVHLAIFGAG